MINFNKKTFTENEIKVAAFSQKIIYIVLIEQYLFYYRNSARLYTLIIIMFQFLNWIRKKIHFLFFFFNKIFLRAFVYRGGGKWKILIIAKILF